jgi:hypothetical protein
MRYTKSLLAGDTGQEALAGQLQLSRWITTQDNQAAGSEVICPIRSDAGVGRSTGQAHSGSENAIGGHHVVASQLDPACVGAPGARQN